MHLWKKVILFSLSLMLVNCSNNQTPTQTNTGLNPTEELLVLFEEWPSNLFEKIDSLAPLFSQQESTCAVYNRGNEFEQNSILIVSEKKESIAPFFSYFSQKAISTSRYEDYYIWGMSTKDGKSYTVSQYPHPVLEWVIEIKMIPTKD